MKKLLSKVLLVLDVMALTFLFLVYGPVPAFQDWYVTTAMTTGTHQYLAYILYSQDMVEDILARNTVTVTTQQTDTTMISFTNETVTEYSSEYEIQILEHDEDQLYKVIEISGNGYSGWITVLYDPSMLQLAVSDSDSGQKVSSFAREYNALVAVNGGGYTMGHDKDSAGGLLVNGKVVEKSYSAESLITLDKQGRLVLVNDTVENLAEEGNTEWALSFYPFLIVNGERSLFTGNAGGQQPRTAIGQRADGIILLVTIEGRGANGSMGINYSDLTDIFEKYGCINAANLDGGGSTTLVVEQEVINDPVSFGKEGERKVYDALVYY